MSAYDRVGRIAIRISLAYLGRRYRRQIRIGVGVGALLGAAAVAGYLSTRNPPEG